jgi:hypothetical protein
MFGFTSGLGTLRHFFVAAPFTLPHRKDGGGIPSILIDGAIGRNYFATAFGAGTAACGANFNVKGERVIGRHNLVVVVLEVLLISSVMAFQNNEDRTKDGNRRSEQYQHTDIEIADEERIVRTSQ